MDYKQLGLKCGLEIHQQLNTTKLFCHCPSNIRDDKEDFTVKRFLRASAGESGAIDQAAVAETNKQKYFVYQGYHDTTCLVELDEEPPHDINPEALTATLQVAKMLNTTVVDNIRVMRKTVVDGSNTTGFQRTALIGMGGSIAGVGVESVCLEEDAAKIIERNSSHDIYNLSKLGIPLVEIATAPDITTPEQAKQVAQEIGMVLRSTGKVKRGIGTIRQDLNVSIKGGVRVEIKGVQELKLLPLYVAEEAMRQKNLLDIYAELKKRKAKALSTLHDVSALFAVSSAKVILSALKKKNGVVLALVLPGYEGLLGREIQTGRRLGSELSDYAKTQGVKGLFHSDELPAYGIEEKNVQHIRKQLHLSKEAFILIADEKEVAERSLQVVLERLNHLGLPKEVRKPLPNGTSSFMRPMPGADRMYPETDVPAVMTPSMEDIELPELIDQKALRYKKQYAISADLAGQLAKKGIDFDAFCSHYTLKPTLLAESLIVLPKDLKKRYDVEFEDDFYEESLQVVLNKLQANEISVQALPDILALMAQGKEPDWKKYAPVDEHKLDDILKKVIAKDPKAPLGALMGDAMKALGGKADGKLVMKKLQELLR